jgi:hypothetical protein
MGDEDLENAFNGKARLGSSPLTPNTLHRRSPKVGDLVFDKLNIECLESQDRDFRSHKLSTSPEKYASPRSHGGGKKFTFSRHHISLNTADIQVQAIDKFSSLHMHTLVGIVFFFVFALVILFNWQERYEFVLPTYRDDTHYDLYTTAGTHKKHKPPDNFEDLLSVAATATKHSLTPDVRDAIAKELSDEMIREIKKEVAKQFDELYKPSPSKLVSEPDGGHDSV